MEESKQEKREVQLIETEDGSHSLYVPSLNETYHSFHGAIRESQHVFIQTGLNHWIVENPKKNVRILEVGFGTGLNALLSFDYALTNGVNIFYHTLEPCPLEATLVKQLNYPAFLANNSLEHYFQEIHAASWNTPVQLESCFTIQKELGKLQSFETANESFDIVFFDAFAPNKQAELWTLESLKKVYECLGHGGVLVTYCAKGQLKRDLKSLGFEVETLPGPPGKKEMVRGIKF